MNTIIYKKDGIELNGEFIPKQTIDLECGKQVVQECREREREREKVKKKREEETQRYQSQSSDNSTLMAHYTLMSTCTSMMNNF